MSKRYELFHSIADPGSAAARRVLVERELDQVRLRNVHYPEVLADLHARGGGSTPALWDGETLVEGEQAVVGVLQSIPHTPREDPE